MSEKNIIEMVKAAGVVGAGGAGFPTQVKLQARVDTVIANGAECEPLLRGDQQMMARYPEEVVRGLLLVKEATGAARAIIALKKKYHEAIAALEKVINRSGNGSVKIHLLDNFYPAGDEFVLVYETTGRIIPEGGLPLQVGCVVDNVVTLINISRAVEENKPVTERPVTITGAVKNPQTLILPIGTSVVKAIALAGGPTVSDFVILDGGPMMGVIVSDDAVITKKTSGILVLPADSEVVTQKSNRHAVSQVKSACEQCQDCTEICPRYLLGHNFECHKIQRGVQAGKAELLTQAFMCCECGLCDWICPVKLTPRRVNQEVKKSLMAAGIKNPHNQKPEMVREMRQFRKVPVERILARLDLLKYDQAAPLKDIAEKEITEVSIPLRQHVGVPAIATVRVGDIVKKGDLIGEIPEGKLAARVHSSIDGKVREITAERIKIVR